MRGGVFKDDDVAELARPGGGLGVVAQPRAEAASQVVASVGLRVEKSHGGHGVFEVGFIENAEVRREGVEQGAGEAGQQVGEIDFFVAVEPAGGGENRRHGPAATAALPIGEPGGGGTGGGGLGEEGVNGDELSEKVAAVLVGGQEIAQDEPVGEKQVAGVRHAPGAHAGGSGGEARVAGQLVEAMRGESDGPAVGAIGRVAGEDRPPAQAIPRGKSVEQSGVGGDQAGRRVGERVERGAQG